MPSEIKFHPEFASSRLYISREYNSHATHAGNLCVTHVALHTVGVQHLFSKYSTSHIVCGELFLVSLDLRAPFAIRAISLLVLQTAPPCWFTPRLVPLPAFCCEHPFPSTGGRVKLDSYLLLCTKPTPNGSQTTVDHRPRGETGNAETSRRNCRQDPASV